jgi:hypothetical protein
VNADEDGAAECNEIDAAIGAVATSEIYHEAGARCAFEIDGGSGAY